MSHEHIQNNISELLTKSGFAVGEVTITHDEKSNTLWFAIESPNARHLLAREGEALKALNHLATKIVEKMIDPTSTTHPRVILDANGFEKKKIENLKTVAHMMAERARYFKSSIDVDPMPPHERRIIHEFLSEMSDIKTESVGEGMKRHIVIKYVDSKI